ncbi:P-loop containing nucleoside triphosphate hydrolase protein [Choiromyces venosus 120613-1]|uniref:RNA helicase n=1 Tax=Choiromyces venosus 120613-1 TaxID=1336337 RepID=A0A3N4JCM6_9PEZI|nr:P-loop containing nucleoside triphosphate hydrolase protein [Choiromyces venosus 120613-1]
MASASLRNRPSRFILSNRVSVKPDERKRKAEPTHGMNRTEANIPQSMWRNRRSSSRQDDQAKGRFSKNEKLDPKHMRMAQSLGVISRAQRYEVQSEIDKWVSFDDFDLLPSIKEGIAKGALKGLDTTEPSPVQKLAIPVLTGQTTRRRHKQTINDKNPYETFLIAAETGSGKTLAYVVPILDQLKRSEEASRKNDTAGTNMEKDPAPKAPVKELFDLEIPIVEPKEDKENHGKPRAVILVPTSELVTQVASVVKSISHVAKFRTTMISSNLTGTVIRNRLFSGPLDVLVSTPYLLSSLAISNPKILSKCTHLVADEADSLFDREFIYLTTSIIDRAQALKKLILCSATIPKSLDNRLAKFYPAMQRLVTSKIHTVPRRVVLSVVDVHQNPYRRNKLLACADTLSQIAKEHSEEGFVKKVIVFVNRRESTTEIVSFLREKGFDAANLNRDTDDRRNTSVVDYFTGPKVSADPEAPMLEKMKVLVTTDIASRGVDTKTVKNVLLYDVPYSTIDFIHRLGRVGRMGKRGKAVLFVDNDTNKAWVKEIKKSMFLGGPLL